jgi:hypothetical protein
MGSARSSQATTDAVSRRRRAVLFIAGASASLWGAGGRAA